MRALAVLAQALALAAAFRCHSGSHHAPASTPASTPASPSAPAPAPAPPTPAEAFLPILIPGRYLADTRNYATHPRLLAREARPEGLRLDLRFDSQNWSPPGQGSMPPTWSHTLRLFIPKDLPHPTCLLSLGGGDRPATGRHPRHHPGHPPRRHPGRRHPPGHAPGHRRPPRHLPQSAVTLAVDQGVVVARLDAVPNQPLRLGPGPEEREDALVAHSWDHYLSDPEGLPYASIHLPMMRAVVAAMDLVQTVARKEGVEVRDFVLTGGSKRAWAAWLASIQDARVRAIIPTSADFWNLEANFVHIHRSYAAWPPALKDYEQYRITSRLLAADPALKRCLIAFEDPLGYLDPALDGRFRPRLEIPKFLISASGDDFTVPDSPQFFLGALPGPTAFRALPNQGHGVEPEVLDQAIAPVLRRLLDGRPFPAVTCQWRQEGRLSLASPEQPTRVRLWRAENPAARDFRFHSGIRFTAQDLDADGTGPPWTYTARPPVPTQGWSAQFLEATYPDGLVLTTPVAVWPLRYPDGSPVAYPSFRPE